MRSREEAEASNLRMLSSLHPRAALFIHRCTNLPQRIKGRFQAFLGQKEFLAEMCLGSSWLDCAYPSHRQFLMKRPQTAYAILRRSQFSAWAVHEGYAGTHGCLVEGLFFIRLLPQCIELPSPVWALQKIFVLL